MADLRSTFLGIESPNPFWLASAPPTNSGGQVMRAFDEGWGGAVWKTLGVPIENVTSRFAAIDYGDKKVMGFNNIELITDRPLEVNLREMAEVKRRYPKHALVASLMVESKEEWRTIIRQVEDVGSDALELNFGCPHGMCERGMGSAVGQEPKAIETITSWAKEFARVPVIVKLTPNITDVTRASAAAARGGADAVSLINTIKSLMGVDLDRLVPYPNVNGKSTNGGYCGPAVKPIALHMVAAIARAHRGSLPISGIGGVSNWRDAAEFLALGATNVQVCTAVMHYGYRIVRDLIQGLSDYLDSKGISRVQDLVGRAVPGYVNWEELDRSYHQVAVIHEERCIGCNLCVVACDDGGHQCIALHPEMRAQARAETRADRRSGASASDPREGLPDALTRRAPIVHEPECVGCNLCSVVCPAPGAITMEPRPKSLLHSDPAIIADGRSFARAKLAEKGERCTPTMT